MPVYYAVTNPSFKTEGDIKLVKFGQTKNVSSLPSRMRSLQGSGVPEPFTCIYAVEVPEEDTKDYEKLIHDALDRHRQSNNREFFTIGERGAKALMKMIPGKNVTPEAPNQTPKSQKNQKTSSPNRELNENYLEFWTGFVEFAKEQDPNARWQKAHPLSYYNVAVGTSIAYVIISANSRENSLRCSLYIRNKDLFTFLESREPDITEEIGQKYKWDDSKRTKTISIEKKFSDIFSKDDAREHFTWLYEKTNLFKKVFPKHIKSFDK